MCNLLETEERIINGFVGLEERIGKGGLRHAARHKWF